MFVVGWATLIFSFLFFAGCRLLYCDDDCIGLFLYFCIISIFIVLIITKFQLGKLFVNNLACICGVVWCVRSGEGCVS